MQSPNVSCIYKPLHRGVIAPVMSPVYKRLAETNLIHGKHKTYLSLYRLNGGFQT